MKCWNHRKNLLAFQIENTSMERIPEDLRLISLLNTSQQKWIQLTTPYHRVNHFDSFNGYYIQKDSDDIRSFELGRNSANEAAAISDFECQSRWFRLRCTRSACSSPRRSVPKRRSALQEWEHSIFSFGNRRCEFRLDEKGNKRVDLRRIAVKRDLFECRKCQ